MVDNELARVKNRRIEHEGPQRPIEGDARVVRRQVQRAGGPHRQVPKGDKTKARRREKKTLRVAFLNRKLQLHLKDIDLGPEEAMGPLENEIRMLRKETGKIKEECARLQGVWLADQTRLVEVAQRTESAIGGDG